MKDPADNIRFPDMYSFIYNEESGLSNLFLHPFAGSLFVNGHPMSSRGPDREVIITYRNLAFMQER